MQAATLFQMIDRCTMPPMEKTPGPLQLLDITMRVLFLVVTLFVGVVAYQGNTLMKSVNDHEKRIVAIEANRYTSKDAVTDMRLVNANLSALRTWIEASYPPEWLRDDVNELKEEIKKMRADMASGRRLGN